MTAVPFDRAPADRWGGNMAALASTVIWAAGFPAAEGLLDTWSPIPLVAARLLSALLLLWPLLLILQGMPRGLPWLRALGIGGLGLGGGAVLLITAQAVTDPVTVAVIACSSPLLATLVEWVAHRRPTSRMFALGLGFSVVGGVVASWGGEAAGGSLLLGAALCLGSCLIYSWATHQSVAALPGQTNLARTTATVTGGCLAGLAAAVLWWLAGGEGPPAGAPTGSDLGLLLVYGVGAMAVSQMLFVRAVERIGVALASFHLNVAPFYVMLILLAMGGGWSWLQAAGAAIVLAGVLLAQR